MIYMFLYFLRHWIIRPTIQSTFNLQHLSNTDFKHIYIHTHTQLTTSLHLTICVCLDFCLDFNGFLVNTLTTENVT